MASLDPMDFRASMMRERSSRSSLSQSRSRFLSVLESDVLKEGGVFTEDDTADERKIEPNSAHTVPVNRFSTLQRAGSVPFLSTKDSSHGQGPVCSPRRNPSPETSAELDETNLLSLKKTNRIELLRAKQRSVSSLGTTKKNSDTEFSSPKFLRAEMSGTADQTSPITLKKTSRIQHLLTKQLSGHSLVIHSKNEDPPSPGRPKHPSHLLAKQHSVNSLVLLPHRDTTIEENVEGRSNNFYQLRALWTARSQRNVFEDPTGEIEAGPRWQRPPQSQRPEKKKKPLREFMEREVSVPVLPVRSTKKQRRLESRQPHFSRRASTGTMRFQGEPDVSFYWTPNGDESATSAFIRRPSTVEHQSQDSPPDKPRRRGSTGIIDFSVESARRSTEPRMQRSKRSTKQNPRFVRRSSTGMVQFSGEPKVRRYWNPNKQNMELSELMHGLDSASKSKSNNPLKRKFIRRESTGSIISSDESTLRLQRLDKRAEKERKKLGVRPRMARRASTGSSRFQGEVDVSFYWKPNRQTDKLPLQLLNRVDNEVPPHPNPPMRPRRRGSTGGVRFAEEPTICYFSRSEGELSKTIIKDPKKEKKAKKNETALLWRTNGQQRQVKPKRPHFGE